MIFYLFYLKKLPSACSSWPPRLSCVRCPIWLVCFSYFLWRNVHPRKRQNQNLEPSDSNPKICPLPCCWCELLRPTNRVQIVRIGEFFCVAQVCKLDRTPQPKPYNRQQTKLLEIWCLAELIRILTLPNFPKSSSRSISVQLWGKLPTKSWWLSGYWADPDP